MTYNPADTNHRRSIRIKEYDYSLAGAYFITICTQGKKCLFGDIVNGAIELNQAGLMIDTIWNQIPNFYKSINIDAYQIMPNHIHGTIIIQNDVGAGPCACPSSNEQSLYLEESEDLGQPQGAAPTGEHLLSLADIIGRHKTLTTYKYIQGVTNYNWTPFDGKLWQRNYYEHVIRNEHDLESIREYITNNPIKWELESEVSNLRQSRRPVI